MRKDRAAVFAGRGLSLVAIAKRAGQNPGASARRVVDQVPGTTNPKNVHWLGPQSMWTSTRSTLLPGTEGFSAITSTLTKRRALSPCEALNLAQSRGS
jgi:hypothetical protein